MLHTTITYNQTVKEAIALSLLQLLKYKSITQISISEIIRLAGVGRSSFYRNFESKEQVLSDYVQYLYKTYFKSNPVAASITNDLDLNRFLYMRFHFIHKHQELFTILRKNNLLYYIFETLDPEMANALSGTRLNSDYAMAVFSSCSAGLIRQWIDHGFKESEEEMISILSSISSGLKNNALLP